jgi:hypothetical protein
MYNWNEAVKVIKQQVVKAIEECGIEECREYANNEQFIAEIINTTRNSVDSSDVDPIVLDRLITWSVLAAFEELYD